jgi:plasmid stabilization system protein ParE
MKIVLLQRAIRDFDNIQEYYIEKKEFEYLVKIENKIQQGFKFLKKFPEMGKSSVKDDGVREFLIREIHLNIPYQVKGDIIEILSFFDTRREPKDSWKDL